KPDTTKPDTTKPDTTKPDTTKPDATKPNRYDLVQKVEPGRPRSKLVPILVGVGGLALVGGSVGFMVWAGSTYEKAQNEGNDDKQLDLWHSANTRRYVAEGLGAAGIAAIGVSVWLYLRSGSEPQRTIDHPAMIVPAVDGERATFVVSGRF
ncbi:MAG TPA: hypothetical protein VFV99_05370, partial [Kofleriaceae bacterium]|nr:hypothetical protein [Kofleriaceae bacterium]